ncbi:hypothetical protein OC709_02210 ['Planchonia careya' phytoplasma]|nr:hypothetical protein ['Planchonia careya' phytoplasma]MDO8030312.1 hypothetical protein ['Planchonia careya' phytoplasma]
MLVFIIIFTKKICFIMQDIEKINENSLSYYYSHSELENIIIFEEI